MNVPALLRAIVPVRVRLKVKEIIARQRGNLFHNQGAIRDADFDEIRRAIDEVRPDVFVELGTGRGVSTTKVFEYISAHLPECSFFTVELFQELHDAVANKYAGARRFTAIHGLTVTPDETTNPARSELRGYDGPIDVLRDLLRQDLKGRHVDIGFIDTRKGSALPEFRLLESRLSPGGVIFCHDVLNGGKGVEVLAHLENNPNQYTYEILDTGPEGLLKIRRRQGGGAAAPSAAGTEASG